LVEKRTAIIESGVIELVLQLPSHLFNQTGIAPSVWLINKEIKYNTLSKMNQNNNYIYFLHAEKFSE
jgi:hypothetical protein